MLKKLAILLFVFYASVYADELLEVASPETGFFASAEPTRVMFWENPGARGTILFVPGGDGSFGVNRPIPRYTMTRTPALTDVLYELDNPSRAWNGAFFNSPYSLGISPPVPARFDHRHVDRVISAVRTIYQRTNLPVVLYGHSNGTVSIFEVYTKLQAINEHHMIHSLISSGSRDNIRIPKTISVPVLFLHHRDDACPHTLHGDAVRSYNLAKQRSTAEVKFITISDNPTGGGCFSGSHMYDGLRTQVTRAIDNFVNQ